VHRRDRLQAEVKQRGSTSKKEYLQFEKQWHLPIKCRCVEERLSPQLQKVHCVTVLHGLCRCGHINKCDQMWLFFLVEKPWVLHVLFWFYGTSAQAQGDGNDVHRNTNNMWLPFFFFFFFKYAKVRVEEVLLWLQHHCYLKKLCSEEPRQWVHIWIQGGTHRT
jgi:hypothetical protein